jgi:uncharacterized membrane protein
MSMIEQGIEVDCPVRSVYNQWTQFEQFPMFMADVERVEQLDDTHLHWKAEIAGKTEEWDARITEQIPDNRIAWTSEDGIHNAGVVTFHKLADNKTRVMLQLEVKPDSIIEKAGDALGVIKRRTKDDMERFKTFLESNGCQVTGAWRGKVEQN